MSHPIAWCSASDTSTGIGRTHHCLTCQGYLQSQAGLEDEGLIGRCDARVCRSTPAKIRLLACGWIGFPVSQLVLVSFRRGVRLQYSRDWSVFAQHSVNLRLLDLLL